MQSVQDAIQHLINSLPVLDTETLPIQDTFGRILGVDVAAQHDLPPFANSSMDGYAVIHTDLASLPTTLQVIEDIPAGHLPRETIRYGQASRIMTGAPLPNGADTVVPIELTADQQNTPTLPPTITILEAVNYGSNIRQAGEDVQAGEAVLHTGRRLRAADIGILAGLGYSHIAVRNRPKVAILSTGDELLMPDQPLLPGKIRDMNGYTLSALVTACGGIPLSLGIARDTVDAVRQKFQEALAANVNLIISSAGVSVGAFDVVKTVLEELGKLEFWKVNMRPGKPLTVGHLDTVPYVGLPGNPVSAIITFMVFVRPMLATMLGQDPTIETITAITSEPIESDGRMTFARVRLERKNGQLIAYSTGTQSSGAISSLVKADALLIIPAGITHIDAGQPVEVWPLDF